ncbi:MAG: hypothetical protein DRJ65_20595 [Acidobacteria bacterium]|nr:MAG: hypothetical protein DRJ65_20595 [Acidobacteriota bacterium]
MPGQTPPKLLPAYLDAAGCPGPGFNPGLRERLGKQMFADGTSQADRRCRALGSSEIDLNLGVGKLELSYQIGFSQSCPTRFPTIPMPGTHRPV